MTINELIEARYQFVKRWKKLEGRLPLDKLRIFNHYHSAYKLILYARTHELTQQLKRQQ